MNAENVLALILLGPVAIFMGLLILKTEKARRAQGGSLYKELVVSESHKQRGVVAFSSRYLRLVRYGGSPFYALVLQDAKRCKTFRCYLLRSSWPLRIERFI